MKFRQLIHCRRYRSTEVILPEPTQNLNQVQHGGMAYDIQWVVLAESGSPKNIAAHVIWNRFSRAHRGQNIPLH
jgi:hypothetical protein